MLESYAMTGSNREQRNLAYLSAKILTDDLSILTVLNPSLKALVDECSSEIVKKTGHPLDTRRMDFESSFELKKLLLSALITASIQKHQPTENKSGFARALAVVIPELKLKLSEPFLAAIAIGAVGSGGKKEKGARDLVEKMYLASREAPTSAPSIAEGGHATTSFKDGLSGIKPDTKTTETKHEPRA